MMEFIHDPLTNQTRTTGDQILSDSNQSTPLPPLDPAYFDYVYYVEDLTQVSEPWSEDTAFLPTSIVYGIAFVAGLSGNILVMFTLLADKQWRSVISFFLFSLALADVVFLLVCLPYEIILKFSSGWTGGKAFCKLAGFVEMLTALTSVLNLVAVSIERYAVIVHPIKSRMWCSRGRTQRIIIIIWIVAAVLSCPLLHIMNTTQGLYYSNSSHVIKTICADSEASNPGRIVFAWYQLMVMFILPVAMMAYGYSFVISVLWASTKQLSRMTLNTCSDDFVRSRSARNSSNQPKNSKYSLPEKSSSNDVKEVRKQIIKMLLTIIAVFFCCWGPKLVLSVMKRHQLSILFTDAAFYVMLTVHLLPYLQSLANPFIYSFMSHNFRQSLHSACLRVCARGRQQYRKQSSCTALGSSNGTQRRIFARRSRLGSDRSGAVVAMNPMKLLQQVKGRQAAHQQQNQQPTTGAQQTILLNLDLNLDRPQSDERNSSANNQLERVL